MSRNKIILGAALALAMVLLAALLVASGGDRPIEPPLPNPNGYDLVGQAAALVNLRLRDNIDKLGEAELEAIVRDHQAALDLARRGLTLPARVPTPASMDEYRNSGTSFKIEIELARLLAVQGRLQEVRGDYVGAARTYLDLVRLGPATSRGGLVGHLLTGHGVARIGASSLARIATRLNADDCRAMAMAVTEQIRRLPSFAENDARERALFIRSASLGEKFASVLHRRTRQANAAVWRGQAATGLAKLQKSVDELAARAGAAEQSNAR